MTRVIRAGGAALVAWGLLASASITTAGQTNGLAGPPGLLREIGFTPSEIARIARGGPVTRTLETDSREIAVAGAVRIRAPRQRLVERFRSVEYLRGSRAVLHVGEVGLPPRAPDFASMPFAEYDLDLRECRPSECRVRLGEADIARFHRDANWDAAGWQDRSTAVWRDVLASYATGYLTARPPALPVFVNKDVPLRVADEQQILREHFAFLRAAAPGVLEHLADPAGAPLAGGASRLLYWSIEDFGVRPVPRLTYQVVLPMPAQSAGQATDVVATNQIYAAHYLDAAIGVVLAIESPAHDAGGFYMVAVNRARTRSLGGFFRRMVRSTVQGRSRDALERILVSTKAALEASY